VLEWYALPPEPGHTRRSGRQSGTMVASVPPCGWWPCGTPCQDLTFWLVLRRHVETGELKTSLCNAPGDTAGQPMCA